MLNKEKYQKFCREVYVPLFSQPWWLDAVCGEENWDVFLVKKGGNILAAVPYFILVTDNKKVIARAPLSQNNGIIFNYPARQKYCTKLDFEECIINEVCDFVESLALSRYEQQYHYSFLNWIPFFWRRYQEVTRYTYVIEDTSDIGEIENNFSPDARNFIRKAAKIVDVVEDLSINDFYRVNKLTFDRQGLEIPYSFALLEKIHSACLERNCEKMLFAVDRDNNIHSVAYIVWDDQSVYYLLNGGDPDYRSSQANSLLVYESIKVAAQLQKKFDFEGSVVRQISRFYRSFGGVQKPYFKIYKDFE